VHKSVAYKVVGYAILTQSYLGNGSKKVKKHWPEKNRFFSQIFTTFSRKVTELQ